MSLTLVSWHFFSPTCFYIGLDSYDKVLKLFSIARSEFGETLSSFELMDNTTVTCVERNLKLQCPIDNSHQFYVIIELASSRPDIGQLMENVLEKALEDSVIADATTSDQTSNINVSAFDRNYNIYIDTRPTSDLFRLHNMKINLYIRLKSFYRRIRS